MSDKCTVFVSECRQCTDKFLFLFYLTSYYNGYKCHGNKRYREQKNICHYKKHNRLVVNHCYSLIIFPAKIAVYLVLFVDILSEAVYITFLSVYHFVLARICPKFFICTVCHIDKEKSCYIFIRVIAVFKHIKIIRAKKITCNRIFFAFNLNFVAYFYILVDSISF